MDQFIITIIQCIHRILQCGTHGVTRAVLVCIRDSVNCSKTTAGYLGSSRIHRTSDCCTSRGNRSSRSVAGIRMNFVIILATQLAIPFITFLSSLSLILSNISQKQSSKRYYYISFNEILRFILLSYQLLISLLTSNQNFTMTCWFKNQSAFFQ